MEATPSGILVQSERPMSLPKTAAFVFVDEKTSADVIIDHGFGIVVAAGRSRAAIEHFVDLYGDPRGTSIRDAIRDRSYVYMPSALNGLVTPRPVCCKRAMVVESSNLTGAILGLEQAPPYVLIGDPCVQNLGDANNLVVDRRNEFLIFAELLGEIRPQTFMMGNAEVLASARLTNGKSLLDEFCRRAAGSGWTGEASIKRTLMSNAVVAEQYELAAKAGRRSQRTDPASLDLSTTPETGIPLF